ncbi:AAA family ATPase, partial [Candidatus Woesearchaeota archaeon CG11_big_fil_rev_8_21_14_0_20_43_8]
CYLSLDAYQFNDSSIQDLVKEFKKIHGLRINQKVYLFFDEVTSKESFNQELKNLYDLDNSKIFASSSSASLLKDKKAHLTGRSRIIEINPLDFYEFMEFKGYSPIKSEKYLFEKYFKEYMEIGGMPEYVLTADPSYITALVDNIIHKDIVAVHGIRNISVIKDLFRLICERVGKPLSYNKISKVLGINRDSVKNYLDYFCDCHMFYIIEKDSHSLNERIADNKKIYCADVGIRNVTVGFKDLGAVYENMVYLEIKNKSPRYIKESGIELDFRFDDTVIEAKYNSKINEKQEALMQKIKIKNKIIANGVEFFLK